MDTTTGLFPPTYALFNNWFEREPLLAKTTLCVLALIPLLTIAAVLDSRTLNGVNVWIKPIKFNVAIVLYLGTLAWYAGWISPHWKSRQSYRVGTAVLCGTLLLMLPWLYGAALIAEPAHFNRDHPVLAPLYALMGLISTVFTSGTLFYAVLIATNKQAPLPTNFRYAVVSGLSIGFVFTVYMAGELASMESHWIGGSQTDLHGLWPFGWSRDGGDLRVAHFFALHAMHFIPLTAWFVFPKTASERPIASTTVISLLYCALLLFVYFQAKNGQAFLPWLG